MEISKVILNNFKPYFEANEVDLSVNPEQNIVLIGGKNGQGKTSFLVGLVWCIYGERISKVDDTFHREVKGGNYQKFLQSALNRRAETQGISNFSVSIQFSNVELAEAFGQIGQQGSEVTLVRSYDTKSGAEDFKILVDGQETGLVSDEHGKTNFVDDYLVPADAAKFVFFDAEKISDIAEMNIKEQGRVMNDALGNILGLSKYEETIGELSNYIRDLKSRRETNNGRILQIESLRNKLKINTERVEEKLLENEEIEEKIKIVERNEAEYERYLIRGGAKSINVDIEKLEGRKEQAEKELHRLGERLKDISEILPFAISAGKIQELVSQLEIEQNVAASQSSNREINAKAEEFIEALFEQPAFPDGDMKTLQKAFYIQKAQNLFPAIFGQSDEDNLPSFFHDLPKSAVHHIQSVYDVLQSTDNHFAQIFSDHIRIRNEFDDIRNQIFKAKAQKEDETFADYREKLEEAKHEGRNLHQKKGENNNQIESWRIETEKTKEQLDNLLDKVEMSKHEQKIIDEVNRHIAALNDFVETEKKTKCESLKSTLLFEMQRLMHKKDLIDAVDVEIMPGKGGLEVTLLKNGREVPKDLLSTGEKQIYISCLLKAILQEAVSDYPVFIDTPLGRLDKEHKDSFVDTYYPALANQVVLFSTDEEVTLRRYDRIATHVAQTHMLSNTDNITKILPGYFDL